VGPSSERERTAEPAKGKRKATGKSRTKVPEYKTFTKKQRPRKENKRQLRKEETQRGKGLERDAIKHLQGGKNHAEPEKKKSLQEPEGRKTSRKSVVNTETSQEAGNVGMVRFPDRTKKKGPWKKPLQPKRKNHGSTRKYPEKERDTHIHQKGGRRPGEGRTLQYSVRSNHPGAGANPFRPES